MIQQSTFGYLDKIIEIRNLKRYVHIHVHSSAIHNSQEWKCSKCPSTDEWINKCGVYI